MISIDEACRRNARALSVPAVAFGLVTGVCAVSMVLRRDYDWRAWAGMTCMLTFTAVTLWRMICYWRRWAAWHTGHCPDCGYDLRATPARCPECGRASKGESGINVGGELKGSRNG